MLSAAVCHFRLPRYFNVPQDRVACVYRIPLTRYSRSCHRNKCTNTRGKGLVIYYKARRDCPVFRVKLREAIRAYEKRTGQPLTYAELAETSGVARGTIESLGSRPGYNTTLATIDKLCTALGCQLTDLVDYRPD